MKKWINAARLRTLPLSLSGIFLGTLLAFKENKFEWIIFLLACTTTVFLQILSNYANDYGDGIKGTDKARKGEKRAVASGEITAKTMKKAIYITAFLSIASAVFLLSYAYLPGHKGLFAFFIFWGIASVWAAIKYTVGKSAYGYRAMGDLFVFIFFGLVSVLGTYMLYTKSFNFMILYPASAIGLLSIAVLNLNNMRDMKQDKKSGKKTIPVLVGYLYAKNYHAILLFAPFLLGFIFFWNLETHYIVHYLFLILLIPAILLMINVLKTHENEKLDSELKKTAILTLLFSIIWGLGYILPEINL